MKKYDKYKDLSIEWLGEIPSNWEIRRLKSIAEIKTGYTPSREDSENFSHNENGVIWIKPDDLNGDIPISTTKEKISLASLKSSKLASVNTILVNCIGDVGKVGTNGIEALFNQQINSVIFNPEIIEQKYGLYLIMSSKDEHKRLSCINVVPILNQTRQGEIKLPIPQKEVQQKIVYQIDRFSTICDKFVYQKRKYIELLKEYSQSRIYELLTKGLLKNSDLIDSGEQWLGEIPVHWNLKKVQYMFRVIKDIAKEEGYNILSITQDGIKIKDVSKNEGQLSSDYSKYQKVSIGDFAMNHMDLLTGFVDISKFDGVTSPDYRVFQLLDNKVHPQYMLKLFQMCYTRKIFYPLGRGASQLGRWRLGIDAFRSFVLPVPPIDEQKEIVATIEKELNSTEKLINKAEKQIQLIQQYRQSLIYELVTGKRKP